MWCRKRGVESPLFPCVAGRQGQHPQLDCGCGNFGAKFTWSTERLQELVTQFLDRGIVPGRLVAGIVTLLDCVAIAVASGYWLSSEGLKDVISDCFQFANSRQQPRWMLLLVAICRLSQLSHRTRNVFAMSGLVLKVPSLEGVASIGF